MPKPVDDECREALGLRLLDELRADPELAAGLARRAREDAESRHGWSDRAEAILAALSAA